MEKYKNAALSAGERAEDLLGRMTLEEKVAQMDMIRGVELAVKVHEAHFCAVDEHSDFQWDQVEKSFGDRGIGFVHDVYSVPAVLNKLQRYLVEKTRLGIPCIFTGEALHGLSYPGATIFPMPIAMGASFDPELTKETGHAIAAETRSLGIQEILAPNLDLAREPRWGRVEETFGEDTCLSSQMAFAIVTGEQGDDLSAADAVMAEPKHYCVHGIPEGGTNCSPARAGVREVETAYLPVFEAGIKKAGACNAMASYNCIDGETVINSEHYLREVLKERFGLRGYVRADFGAVSRLTHTHHIAKDNKEAIKLAVEAGLDVQGFDFPCAEWEGSLIELVQSGELAESVIDEAVFRILQMKFELGLFEHPYTDEEHYRDVVRCEKHRDISYRMARESIVLLQNKNQVLPLSKELSSIAVLGPGSNFQREGSYASVPWGYHMNSVYEELRDRLKGKCNVYQADGCGVTENDVTLIPPGWYPEGVKMEYYANDSFSGKPVGEETANLIKFNWILAKPCRELPFKGYSVRMKTKLVVNTHDFTDAERIEGRLAFTTNDSVEVYVDGQCVITSGGEKKQKLPACPFTFVNGESYEVEIRYVCDVNGNNLALCIDQHGDDIQAAVELAKNCDAVVLVCGDDKVTSGEGMDRCDLKLYGKQQELIRQAALLKKPTVLVLENGKPVDLSWEKDQVDGILAAWFGGEMGAKAIADVLLGEISPSGKLPVSFPKSVGHLPCYYSALPGGSPIYLEGERKALFPFGFGLSYTTFLYSGLCVEKGEGLYDHTVSFKVKNTGKMASDEIVQLYVNDVCSSVVTPELTLQGFKRVPLKPGEEKEVVFRLGFDNFKLLNKKMEWVVEPGEFRIMIGASSEEIRLTGTVTVKEGCREKKAPEGAAADR